MTEQWILKLSLQHSQGMMEYSRDIASVVDIEIESPRAVDELRAGIVTMTGAVSLMKRRKIRRETVRAVARQLAEQLADTIEDAAGWRGAERAEGVREAGLAKGLPRY